MPTPLRLLPRAAGALLALALVLPLRAQTAPATGPTASPAYKINLSPKFAVGQKFSLDSKVSNALNMTMTITAPSLPQPQNQQMKQNTLVALQGDCEVLALTAEGQPKKISLTIKSLAATKDGAAIPGLPKAGDVIVAEATDKNAKTMTIGGKPLSPDLVKMLDGLVPVGFDGTNDQTMFGPSKPVAVGDTWAPSPAMLADMAGSLPGANAINGQLQLAGVKGTGDNQVAQVTGHLTIAGVKVPMPAQLGEVPADCTVEMSGTFPAVAKGTLGETMAMTMKFSGTADAGGAHLAFSADSLQTGSQTLTLP